MPKRTWCIVCLTVLGILGIAAFAALNGDALLDASAKEQRGLICENAALRIEKDFEQARASVRFASSLPVVVAAVDPLAGKDAPESALRWAREALRRILPDDAATTASFTLLNGGRKVLFSTSETLPGGMNAFFPDVMEGRSALYGPVISEANEAYLVLAEPILRGGRPAGALAGQINLQRFSLNVARFQGDEAGYAFALDSSGRMLLHSGRPELIGLRLEEEPWARTMLREKKGEISYTWSGERRTAAFTPLPLAGWIVAVSFPEEEAAALRRGVWLPILLAAAAAAALLLFVFLLLVKDSLPHLRKGCELAVELLGNDAPSRIPIPNERAALLRRALSLALDTIRRDERKRKGLIDLHEKRFRGALGAMPEAMMETDGGGLVLFANPAALAALDFREAPHRNHVRDLFPAPKGADAVSAVCAACLEARELSLEKVSMRGRDGESFLADISVTPLPGNGGPGGALIAVRDRGAASLREEIAAALMRVVGGTYFVWDGRCRLVDCSETAIAFFRVAGREEILGNPGRFFPELQANGRASTEDLERRLLKAVQEGSLAYDWTYLDGTGEHIPCEVTLRRIMLRGGSGVLGLIRDIRLSRREETKLAVEYAKLKQVLDALPIPVGVTDTEGLLYANDAMEEFLSRYGKEPALAPFSPMPASAGFPEAPVGEIENRHIQFFDWDDQPRDYLLSCLSTEYEGKAALLGWITEVTRLKAEAQEALRERDRAVEAVREKEDFLVRLEREIRRPLNNILFALQEAVGSMEGEKRTQAVNAAYAFVRGVLNTLGYMLHMSGVDSLALHPAFSRFAPAEFFLGLVGGFDEEARIRGLALTCRVDPDVPEELAGDAEILGHILVHLVSNAVKYTLSGGVHVEVAPLRTEKINTAVLHIVVADTGPGLPDAKTAVLFSPPSGGGDAGTFHDASGSHLFIVANYVKLLGGELCVVSEQGEGTEMHLSIPFALRILEEDDFLPSEETEAPAPPPAPRPRARKGGAKGRVLVVDDDAATRKVVTHILQQVGYEADEAEDGERALELLESGSFDLVFMDVAMPGLSGIDVTRRIRKDERGRYPRGIPVVAMTAPTMIGELERYAVAGMNDYLPKPVVIEDVENVLNNLFGAAGAPPEA
jgi:signal transduction histidine kinase/CheY-like chemotaxis protein/PAS domain-containing protein